MTIFKHKPPSLQTKPTLENPKGGLKMRCFTACFHSLKHRKTQKPRKRTALKDLIHGECEVLLDIKQPIDEVQPAELIKTIAQSKDENENQLNTSNWKQVTFNVDVRIYEECTTQEAAECLVENDKKKEAKKEQNKDEADSFSDSITSSTSFISYPLSDRYHNCTRSGDECKDIQLNESDLEDDVTGNGGDGCVESAFVQEESSGSLFSISLDSRKQVSAAEMGDKEVNSPLKPCEREMKSKESNQTEKDRSLYVHSVLNPVENLCQSKAVKAKAAALQKEGKENANLEQETMIHSSAELDFRQIVRKQVCDQRNAKENEVAVDTSLSSWLVASGKTSDSKKSPGSVCNSSESTMSSRRVEERPILGHSPDNMPIIGTVGNYWRQAGRQATESGSGSSCRGHSGISNKCMELGEVRSQSTPFQTRIEKALESGIV